MKTMNTKIITAVLLISFNVFTDSANADDKKQKKFPEIPQMEKLLANIHTQLKSLKKDNDWLSGYNDKCYSGRMISYSPRIMATEEEPLPQQPSQINITYIPIDFKDWLKYSNALEDEKACHFLALDSKVYIHIVIRGKKSADLRKKILQIIIDESKKLKKETANE